MASFSIVFPFVVKVRKKNTNERPRANIYIIVQLIDESSLSVSFELCCRHCSVFVSFFLHWGNWQRNLFRLNSIRRATMTETSFNNHINTFSSAFAHSKCESKLSVVPKSWFFFSGTCDKPLVWNSSKRQIERHLWYRFFTKRKTILF